MQSSLTFSLTTFDSRKAEVHLNSKSIFTIESWLPFWVLRLACLKASEHFILVLVKTESYYSFSVQLNILLFYIREWEVIIIEWNIALRFSFSPTHTDSLFYFSLTHTNTHLILSFCLYLTYCTVSSLFPLSLCLWRHPPTKHVRTHTHTLRRVNECFTAAILSQLNSLQYLILLLL